MRRKERGRGGKGKGMEETSRGKKKGREEGKRKGEGKENMGGEKVGESSSCEAKTAAISRYLNVKVENPITFGISPLKGSTINRSD